VVLRKEGTTAYWKAAFHAPPFEHEAFFPLLVADAVLNGAAGLNIWSMGGVSRPQRSARLYRALVDKGLASSVSGALMPTHHPYLYAINASVAQGQSLASVEEVVLTEIGKLQSGGITPAELKKVHTQLKARFVYDADSVTDIAHQLGYFETISSWRAYEQLRERLDAVTPEAVQAAAQKYLTASNRTIGWFEPILAKVEA
jgi:zinc protease